MSTLDASLERTRQLWTPQTEIAQLVVDLDPRTEIDLIVRDLLHRVVQQRGAMTLLIDQNGAPVLNRGTLRFEVAGVPGYREVSLWIEQGRDDE